MNSIDTGSSIHPIESELTDFASYFNSSLKEAKDSISELRHKIKKFAEKTLTERAELGSIPLNECDEIADIPTERILQEKPELHIAPVTTNQPLSRLCSVNKEAAYYIACAQKAMEFASLLSQDNLKTIQGIDKHLHETSSKLSLVQKKLKDLEENIIVELIHIQEAEDIKSEFEKYRDFLESFANPFENSLKILKELPIKAQKISDTVNNIEELAQSRVNTSLTFNRALLIITGELISDIKSLFSDFHESYNKSKKFYDDIGILDNKILNTIEHTNTLVKLPIDLKSQVNEFLTSLRKLQLEILVIQQKLLISKHNTLDMEAIMEDALDYQIAAPEEAMNSELSIESGATGLLATAVLASSIGAAPAIATGMTTMVVADKVLVPGIRAGIRSVREFTGMTNAGKTIPLNEYIDLKYDDQSCGAWNLYWNKPSTTVGNIFIKLSNDTKPSLRFNLNNRLPIDTNNIAKLLETLKSAVDQGSITPQEALNTIKELQSKRECERDSKRTFKGALLPERYSRKATKALEDLIHYNTTQRCSIA